MKIGIVGGSIAGCSAAILLSKEGHDIMVFERSKKPLVGRGGGIGTIPSLMYEIHNAGMTGDDFSSFRIKKLPFIGKYVPIVLVLIGIFLIIKGYMMKK